MYLHQLAVYMQTAAYNTSWELLFQTLGPQPIERLIDLQSSGPKLDIRARQPVKTNFG